MESKKIALFGMVVAAVVLTGSVIMLQQSIDPAKQSTEIKYLNAYSKNLPSKNPGPVLLTRLYGDVQPSLAVASSKAPDVIAKEAKYLPLGLEQKMILTRTTQDEAPSRLVAIIYAPPTVMLNSSSTFGDVLDHQGIIAYSYKQNPGFDPVKWTKEYAAGVKGAVEIAVNGKPGIAIYGDPQKGEKSQVLFHDGIMQYSVISVAYQPDELLKIAESMQ